MHRGASKHMSDSGRHESHKREGCPHTMQVRCGMHGAGWQQTHLVRSCTTLAVSGWLPPPALMRRWRKQNGLVVSTQQV